MNFRTWAIAAIAIAALGGCATKNPPAATAPPPPVESGSSSAAVDSAIAPGSVRDFQVNVGDTVHFAYDSHSIDADARVVLQRQAAWLKKYPAAMLLVEGYCDERGTREYNLALGARRAHAIREYLAGQGTSANRLDTNSYGKERPVCSESAEGCWTQNRRGVSTIRSGAES
jgi:peptidoglycan-associated lipoprotein